MFDMEWTASAPDDNPVAHRTVGDDDFAKSKHVEVTDPGIPLDTNIVSCSKRVSRGGSSWILPSNGVYAEYLIFLISNSGGLGFSLFDDPLRDAADESIEVPSAQLIAP